MVFINEWLPNPMGSDVKGEFVELFNNGKTAVVLNGWTIKASGKKIVSLSGNEIAAGGYLLLPRTKTKLALKNTDEKLFLYDASGKLVDQSSFLGQAQEGKSLSRINYATDTAEHFAWSEPTPGAANKISANIGIAVNSYPLNAALNMASVSGFAVFEIVLSLGVALAAIMLYAVKQDEDLSKLFFRRDKRFR